jgi:hypothetical protein
MNPLLLQGKETTDRRGELENARAIFHRKIVSSAALYKRNGLHEPHRNRTGEKQKEQEVEAYFWFLHKCGNA